MPQPSQYTTAAPPPPSMGPERNPVDALGQVGLLALGLADLALDQLRRLTDRGQRVAQRSDLGDLVTDGVHELHARGELAARRMSQNSDNYLELMARRVAEQGRSSAE
ncbi:hypothetical protein [Streptomyces sp. NPDC050504]|uniref:hypothetical protein n=1 Tax=Streptomyces sp. NPDC050504 TaxID=3365618 RepID=UPI0037874E35